MKLILTQEINRLGGPGDVVDVADGYGRNYLLPRGFAMQWTRGAEKQLASIRRAREAREIRDRGEAREVAERLEALRITMPTRAGESGRLFGSVTPADIAKAVASAGGPEIDKRRLELSKPIKSLGGHEVRIRLHPEVFATLDVQVVSA